MKSILRLMIVATIGFFWNWSFASGGALDGIYQCRVNMSNYSTDVYITVNGYPNGRAIFAVAASQQALGFWGYGIGNFQNGVFSGTTNMGKEFRMVDQGEGRMQGQIRVWYGYDIDATVACIKVW